MSPSLHPAVAIAPLLGVGAFAILLFITSKIIPTKSSFFRLIISFIGSEVASIWCAIKGTSNMIWLPGESPASLWIMVIISTSALMIVYLFYLHQQMFPVRRLIYGQLMQGGQTNVKLARMMSREDIARFTEEQFSKYKDIGLIQENSTKAYLLKPIPRMLMRIVQELSYVFCNPKSSLLLLIGKNQRFQERSRIRKFLWCNLILALVIFYFVGLQSELDRNVTERTRYHAIPVALSQIHHQRPHDYTGWKVIAIPFQGGEEIKEIIKRSHEKIVTSKSTPYYWLADDRGLSDLVNMSFRVFGETMRGLYNGYFCLFMISILIAGFGLRKSTAALAILNMIVIAYGSYLPNINSASGPAFIVTNYRVHLSESRLFEIVGLVYFCQLILGVALNMRLRCLEIITFIAQAIIFGWLYSCRSSMGWLILCINLMTMCLVIYILIKIKSNNKAINKYTIRKSVWISCASICLLFGVGTFQGWHRLMENPLYLAQGGGRTFFHNALMGLSYHPLFPDKYNLCPDDGRIIASVNENLKVKHHAVFDQQALLNSLGGHGFADWRSYEQASKSFYIELWKKHPLEILKNYSQKMLNAPILARQSMSLKIIKVEHDKKIKLITFWPNPVAAEWVLVLLFPLIILSNYKKKLLIVGAYLVFGFIFSLIPSIAFYSGALTMGGASVLIRMIAYLFLCVACKMIINLYERIKKPDINRIQQNQSTHGMSLPTQIIITAVICALTAWFLFPQPIAQ
jgi:hypothetical protein